MLVYVKSLFISIGVLFCAPRLREGDRGERASLLVQSCDAVKYKLRCLAFYVLGMDLRPDNQLFTTCQAC
jgi:hypothetical protein